MRRFLNVSNIRKLVLFVEDNKKIISLVFATVVALAGTEQVTDGAISEAVSNNIALIQSANAKTT